MRLSTSELLTYFVDSIDMERSYQLHELESLLINAYNYDTILMKNKPSTYNRYVKIKMNELRKMHPEMSIRDIMKIAVDMWNKGKALGNNDVYNEIVDEDSDDKDDDEEYDDEEDDDEEDDDDDDEDEDDDEDDDNEDDDDDEDKDDINKTSQS